MNARQREIIDAAKYYAARSWSVIPIGSEKKPLGRWKHRQSNRATPGEIEREFKSGSLRGVGIVLGEVSGCLYVRDFDKRESYELWKATHPELASTLPTVQTGKGYHVYYRLQSAELRVKADTKKNDGEFRGNGGYVVAPPSIHPSGAVYEWIVPLGREVPLVVDVRAAGLYVEKTGSEEGEPPAGTDGTEAPDVTDATDAPYGIDGICSEEGPANVGIRSDAAIVEELLLRFRPGPSTHDATLWDLVRKLKAVPGVRHASLEQIKPAARRWWEVHRQHINRDSTWSYTWGKFSSAWSRAVTATGETLAGAVAECDRLPLPDGIREYADDPDAVRIAKLCGVLQRRQPSKPFLLAYRALELDVVPQAVNPASAVESPTSSDCQSSFGVRARQNNASIPGGAGSSGQEVPTGEGSPIQPAEESTPDSQLRAALYTLSGNLDPQKSGSAGSVIHSHVENRIKQIASNQRALNSPLGESMVASWPTPGIDTPTQLDRIVHMLRFPCATELADRLREHIVRPIRETIECAVQAVDSGAGLRLETLTAGKLTAAELATSLIKLRELIDRWGEGLDKAEPFDANLPARVFAIASKAGEAATLLGRKSGFGQRDPEGTAGGVHTTPSAPAIETAAPARPEAAAEVDSHAIERAAEKMAERIADRVESRIGGPNTDWKNVEGRLLAKRDRGEPYSTLRKLAGELKCSDATIRKAIKGSDTLKGWRARSTGPKAAPKATDLSAMVQGNTRQTTEPAPDDVLSDDDVDAAMARLIDQAKPDERAKLNTLDHAGRRALVATYHAQNLDIEPSPLESDNPGETPRRVMQQKRA